MQRISGLLRLGLNGVLLLIFALQAFIVGCVLVRGYLPLPVEWVNRTLDRRLPEGVQAGAAAFRLYPGGALQIESLQLFVAPHELPIFTAGHLNLKPGLARGNFLKPQLKGLTLSDGRFYIPAVYAPDGRRGPLLERIAANLRPRPDGVSIDAFTATYGQLAIRGSAELPLPMSSAPESFDAMTFMPQLFAAIQPILREAPLLQDFEDPALRVAIGTDGDGSLELRAQLTGSEWIHCGFRCQDVAVSSRLSFAGGQWESTDATLLEAATITLDEPAIEGVSVRALLQPADWAGLLQGNWPKLQIAADSLNLAGRQWPFPQLDLVLQDLPSVRFAGTTAGLNGAFALSGSVDLEARTADLHASGTADLLALAGPGANAALGDLVFADLPYYTLDVSLAEGFTLRAADLRAQTGPFVANGIHFDHLQARGSYREGRLDLPEIYLARDWQWLDLGLSYVPSSQDYRVRLIGSAKPYDYNALLPSWWAAIFRDFDFESVSEAKGDFIIYGNTAAKAADLFFGNVQAAGVTYRGVQVEEGSLFVRGRGPYAEIFDMDLRHTDGWTRGALRFSSRLDSVRGPESTRFDLHTRIRIEDAKRIFDEDIAALLGDFEAANPVDARLRGVLFNEAYPEHAGRSFIDLQAQCPHPLHYKGIALDDVRFDLFGRAARTHLRDIHIGFAGGRITAAADLSSTESTGPQIRLEGHLSGADQSRVSKLLQTLTDQEKDQAPAAPDAVQQGRFDARLHAEGPVDDIFALEGFGRFRLENDALGQIQLFGPISALLERARLGYTTFRFESMEGTFAMNGGQLHFDPLRIDGPQTRILAPGTFGLADQTLDMRVSVYLFGNAGNPESPLRQLQQWVTQPFPNLLEFQLSGTLDDQRWRSLYDPRNLLMQPLNLF